MWRLLLLLGFGLLLTSPANAAIETAARPTEVMIVGLFHLANPGRDLHDVHVDDVLAPKPQAELAAITAALARFHPTRIATEWPAEVVAERYPKYIDGSLPASRNEDVQLGFRLARSTGASIHGIDVPGDFPFEAVQAFATAHGREHALKALDDQVVRRVSEMQSRLDRQGIAAALRYVNDPARLNADNDFYRDMLRFGDGKEQPGADLLAAWYRRNFLICANLLQLARPGDRIIVFYGSGHAFLLRQCVTETPGFKLVEAEDYLPR